MVKTSETQTDTTLKTGAPTTPHGRSAPVFPGPLASQEELLFLRKMIDCVPDYLFAKDLDGRFVVANRAVAEDLGLTVADLIGKTDFQLHRPELASKFASDEQQVIAARQPRLDIEEFVVTALGDRKWLSTSKLPLLNADDQIVGIVGVSRDVTARKHAEEALAESQSRWSFALEGAGQGVWDHDLRQKTAYFSPTWRAMRGIGSDEEVDSSRAAWMARVHPDDRERIAEMADMQNSGELKQNSFEYRERHRDGRWIWILSRGRPVEWMPDGTVARIIGTDTDITMIKEAAARAAEEKAETYRKHLAALKRAHEATEAAHKLADSMARHDPLTGLPNRRVFSEALQRAVARAGRGSASCAALIVDLDRFKPVNDVHGHAAGDDVLREVAARLSGLLRATDVVARLGGDEFGIVVDCGPSDDPAHAATALIDRLLVDVQKPIETGGQTVEVGASVGIALCPRDGTNPEAILRAADMAMYRAKEEGRGGFRFFDHSMERALRGRLALEDDLRQAVNSRAIVPYYQPLMHLAENRLVGFEVLARWPERDVGPDVFIPIVEKLGLIGELTYDLLRRACLDARGWPSEITIAINVSPLLFSDPLFAMKMLAILSETDLPPRRLEVEVTETALVNDIEAARAALATLQGMGIKISLDDFGTGYSSLYNLRELKFDKIKIDRSFVAAMHSNEESAKIVRSVINLAKSLGLPTIAEGIEHRDAMQDVIENGGEFGQGFLFGQAMPAREAGRLVHRASAQRKRRPVT